MKYKSLQVLFSALIVFLTLSPPLLFLTHSILATVTLYSLLNAISLRAFALVAYLAGIVFSQEDMW